MQNFIDSLFSWIGFTVIAWVVFIYFFYNKFPKITIDVQKPPETIPKGCSETNPNSVKNVEAFAVDLNAYQTTLPTVYSKNCAFDGIKPKGYIPNLKNWSKYSSMLP